MVKPLSKPCSCSKRKLVYRRKTQSNGTSHTSQPNWTERLNRTQRSHIRTSPRWCSLLNNSQRRARRAQTPSALAERNILILFSLSLPPLPLIIDTHTRRLAAIRTADVPFIMTLNRCASRTIWWMGIELADEVLIFCICILLFGFATLPTISPFADQELEAESVDFHARLEANAKISVIHLVLFGMRKEEREMASDSEKQVVVERRKV